MKNIFTCMLMLLCSLAINAQTPTYFLSQWAGPGNPPQAMLGTNTNNGRFQCIYSGAYFPGMPKGEVTAVYLRTAGGGHDTITYHNVELSLGITADSAWSAFNSKWDTFKTELTKVYSAPTHFFSGAAVTGNWFRFPASSTFIYDPARHFVVEFKYGPEGGDWQTNNYGGFQLMATTSTVPLYKTLGAARDSIRSKSGQTRFLVDIGFDIAVTGVPGIENLRSLGLFPNPCTEERFMLSLSAKEPMRTVSITLTDALGRQALRKDYSNVGNDFFEGISTHGLAKGIYIVRINAGGEHMSRQLIIQ